VCSGNDFEKELVCQDYLVTKEMFAVDKCKKCGFAFTQDFPDENEIGKYYDAPEYISHSDTRKGFVSSLYHVARKISLKSKRSLIQKYTQDKSGTLLDIGCGTGYFLHSMCEKKWVVTGIEKSEATRAYAHKKFGLNIQRSDYLEQIPAKTKYVITMWHVLEHIEKLNATMEILHRILKDDGVLFIALPNKDSFDAKNYKEWWAAYDVPRHLWHFSPEDFCLFAGKHHFSVKKMKKMNFDPFYISMLSEKNKGTFAASIVGIIKGFYFFVRTMGNVKRSSSIIYILKKKQEI